MMSISNILSVLILIIICIYTVTFGWWTWKRKNYVGAIMVFVLAMATFVLPIYTLFIRG